jgi:NAD(P)-dependent dehydrogenase (short-subunit alcohol dehydrogenase family)
MRAKPDHGEEFYRSSVGSESEGACMTKSVVKLVRERGVRVNAVAPGPVGTPLFPSTMPPEIVEKIGEDTVFQRQAQPVELAKLFVFLASDDANYVAGEVFGRTDGRTPY